MLNDAILISLVCGVVALVYGGVTAAYWYGELAPK